MIHLFDVNILIALGDSAHPHREEAMRFQSECALTGWATCPLTENAFLRILGNPKYPRGTGSTREARNLLDHILGKAGHHFWPDSLSFMDTGVFIELPTFQKLTDHYLLALAVKHGGRLATFDSKIDPTHIRGGEAALLVLEG
jgi:toxin-antitoxin system PIN domain toxin